MNFKEQLYKAFSTDSELLSIYHIIAPNTLDACVNKTFSDLSGTDTKIVYVKDGDSLIGFFGKEKDIYLNTMFIYPEYRNSYGVTKFLSEIKKEMSSPFYTALYKKNTRAIDFYLKNNSNIIKAFNIDGHEAVLIEVGN